MKTRHISLILALLPISLHAYDGYERHNKFKDDFCPITQTYCPANANFTVTNEAGFTFADAVTAANESCATPQCPFVIAFNLEETQVNGAISGTHIFKKPVCINGFTNLQANECKRKITVPFSPNASIILEKAACGSTVKGLQFCDENEQAPEVAAVGAIANIVVRAPNSRVYGNDFLSRSRLLGQQTTAILVDHASCVTIGGICPNERNIIQGSEIGLHIRSSKTTVVGNHIGPDAHGVRYACGNESSPNHIGMLVIGDCNVIGCKKKCGGNLISGNVINSIVIGSYNIFKHNIVGLDKCAKEPLVENNERVALERSALIQQSSSTNLIGHISIGTYNKIKDSIFSGNLLSNLVVFASSFNKIKHNIIGTNGRGDRSFPTLVNAVLKFSSRNCLEKNLLSARSFYGLAILRSSNNAIKHNVVGSDIHKKCSLGQEVGILVSNGILPELNITLSCLGTLLRNFASQSANFLGPVDLYQGEALNNPEQLLGTLHTAFGARSNHAPSSHYAPTFGTPDLGLSRRSCAPCHPQFGFDQSLPGLHESVNTIIEGNQLLGNLRAGIVVSGARLTKIKENFIGINKKCCIVSNGYGLLFKSDTTLNCSEQCPLCCCCCKSENNENGTMQQRKKSNTECCGERVSPELSFEFSRHHGSQCNVVEKNIIVGNLFNGIAVQGVSVGQFAFTQSFNNAFLKNSIFNNCGDAIRLNHRGNRCLPAPVILSAKRKGDQLVVEIDPASLPDAPFMVEVYANRHCRPGITEGEFFVACKCVTEPLSGPLTITGELKCADVKFASAIVSELSNCDVPVNTSEFSCPVCIQGKVHKSESLEGLAEEEEAKEQVAKKTIEKEDENKLVEEPVERTSATVPVSLRTIALRQILNS